MSPKNMGSSGVLPGFITLTFLIFLNSSALGQEISDGFNYPIGARNPGFVTAGLDGDGWKRDQSYQCEDEGGICAYPGLHSGEDWNDECGSDNDVGAAVYATANGTVVGFGAHGSYGGGQALILRHVNGDTFIYSLYLHIIISADLEFGDTVDRDQKIGTIAAIAAPHLHFELRNLLTIDVDEDGQLGEDLWPNDVGTSSKAYYQDWPDESGETVTAEQRMTLDGLRNPSDFLSSNRPPGISLERGRIPSKFTFDQDLYSGMCRHEIQYLQNLLNLDRYTRVANVDAVGSLGNETSNYGAGTMDAVKRFQEKYLGWNEYTPSYGSILTETRNELNRILRDSRAYPNVDVSLIIDSSGSMGWNDPDDARLDAARAFLTGSFAGDYVGVVDFDGGARLASPLRQLPDAKSILIDAIDTIDSSGGTNIGLGIQRGCEAIIASTSEYNLTKGAILLTDGVGGTSQQRSCFEKRRWPIYTFGLGNGVNDAELESIAADTGGEYTPLPANSLICEFQRVRAKIAGTEPPPCVSYVIFQSEYTTFYVEVEPGQLQISFSVDWLGSDIITTLTTPSGRVIDMNTVAADVTHDKGATFEVFTITNPDAGEWEVELFGADIPSGGEEATFGFVSIPAPVTIVQIDVKPGDTPNPVNLKSKGVIPVAILTTSIADGDSLDFDALDVDPLTVTFGSGAAVEAHAYGHAEDVDGDADLDLVLHFRTQETGVVCGDTNVTLTGETFGGQVLEGTDSISVKGCK